MPLPIPDKARAEALALQKEVTDKISALATAALGLVAALAWNSAIQALFAHYFGPSGTLAGLFAYAIGVTVVAVVVTIWVGRVAGRLRGARGE